MPRMRKVKSTNVGGGLRLRYVGFYDRSAGLAAQEGRDVENLFLDRIRRRRAAVGIEALWSQVTARRAERWALERRCTALDPVCGATVVVAQPAGKFREQAFRRLRLSRRAEIIDAGRYYRDADDTYQAFIEGSADDDVGVRVGLFAYAGSSFVNLE